MDKIDKAKEMVDRGLSELSTALEQGQSQTLRDYLGVMARFHRYSVGNLMLILLQCPHATHVAGYGMWKTMGRHVRMGEKGILILAPVTVRQQAAEPASVEGPQSAEKDPDSVVAFRAVHVFDVSQTEGKPLPELNTTGGDPGDYTRRLKDLVAHLAIDLEYSPDLGSADGLSRGGLITIREGLTPAQEFAVLVHELAHELLHRDEKVRAVTDRHARELEAEAVSYVISEAVGLDAETAATDYIQLYRGDVKGLIESLGAIRQASTQILSALLQPTR